MKYSSYSYRAAEEIETWSRYAFQRFITRKCVMGLGLEPKQFASRVLEGEDSGAGKQNVHVDKGR